MLPPINKTPFHLSGQKKHMDNLLNPLPTVLFTLQEDVPCSNKHMFRTPSTDEIQDHIL